MSYNDLHFFCMKSISGLNHVVGLSPDKQVMFERVPNPGNINASQCNLATGTYMRTNQACTHALYSGEVIQ